MRREPVDNFALEHWRSLDCVVVLRAVADHVRKDIAFVPRQNHQAMRWHVSAAGIDYELVCTGPRFFDTRAGHGGGGAVDLVTHLFQVDFKHAVALLRRKGL